MPHWEIHECHRYIIHVNRHKQFVGPFMFCPVKGWESNTMYNNQESVPVVTIEIHR